jgi:hypothetical protein
MRRVNRRASCTSLLFACSWTKRSLECEQQW